jgi:integrase/recombinase XerD
LLSAYRRWLFHYRNPRTNEPLKFATQASYLIAVRRWFAWLGGEGILPKVMGEKMELPKEEQRLPTNVLNAAQVETILGLADVSTPLGLRDRAMMETFYSTAIRCGELVELEVYDLDRQRRSLVVRQGKGRKDRVLPIGRRALLWLEKYLADVRPRFVERTNSTRLFVSIHGRPFLRSNVSLLVRNYFDLAGIRQRGSCHLLRHTAATLMMENGADLRSLQELLGHARVNTTQIYTHVSIQRLKEVHERTHPAGLDAQTHLVRLGWPDESDT